MNRRRFVNLVVESCGDGIYSLRRINPWKHLFYESIEEAQEAANDGKRKKFDKTLRRLPDPIASFDPSNAGLVSRGLQWFELFAPRRLLHQGRPDGHVRRRQEPLPYPAQPLPQ
jgi:hypothetical protein